MTRVMKKEHALWASVCLLLSLVPELPNALTEEVDGHAEATAVRTVHIRRVPRNPNRFDTLEECKTTCIKGYKEKMVKTTSGAEKPDFCFLKEDPGICRGYFTKYFYNNESKQCEKFGYGGCLGNRNQFETLEECKKTCGDTLNELQLGDSTADPNAVNITLISQSTKVLSRWEYHGPSWCLAPADSGLCRASEKRFYYNSATGKCHQFKYTGCGGNNNNFATRRDCVRACKRGFIKRKSKGAIKIQRRKKPSVKVVYESIS